MRRRGLRARPLRPPLPPAVLVFLLALLPFLSSSLTALAASSPSPPPSAVPARPPIVMLSTIDGTVSAFDARSGDLLFTHRDSRPAVESWTAPGMPEFVPGIDGFLYKIEPGAVEAQVVDGKFINHRASANTDAVASADGNTSPRTNPNDPQSSSDGVILTAEDSSVLYIDVRTGRLLRELKYAQTPPEEPLLPRLSEHVIVVARTSVGIRVLDTATGLELANASLVHTHPSFLDHGRCLSTGDGDTDSYVAYMTQTRNRLIVRSMSTGDVLWTKEMAAPVVEAHGLGGVRIAKSRRDAEAIGRGEEADTVVPALGDGSAGTQRDVLVAKQGKHIFAMLAGPDGDGADEDVRMLGDGNESHDAQSAGSLKKNLQRYRVSNDRDLSTLSSADRLLGLGRLPRRRESEKRETPDDVSFVVTSRDAGLAFLALIVVCIISYKLGSRPRRRDPGRRKVRKRKGERIADHEIPTEEAQRAAPRRDANESDTDPDDEADEDDPTRTFRENQSASRSKGSKESSSDKNSSGQGLLQGIPDNLIESSTGSTGSTGGGFVCNRTESGWMSVGCLQVSSKVLGVGSHGTVVYEGKMMPGERKVAVKRLLRQFFESARKEISLLVELDEASPHVVRYFAMEEDSEFIYLALELCAASLAERVSERGPPVPPSTYVRGPPPHYTSRALRQLLHGLADLHRVGVVHRDVKPQNVLITRSHAGGGDVKLADVGLALRLAANRSSYTAVTNAGGGVGTTGWRAPEVLGGGRQTKAVDIFAAGCVVCFVITGGNHPFGNAIFRRDGNIAAGKPSLEALEALELPEATDIVKKMIDPVATMRPSAEDALNHPFFWTDATKLSFLVDISDRLYDTRHDPARYTENLDRSHRAREFCSDWLVRMDMELLMGLGRGYGNTASGLLRVLRNKRNHYSELSSSLRSLLGELPEDKQRQDKATGHGPGSSRDSEDMSSQGNNFLTYFTSRVPHLLMCVYLYAIENPLLIDQSHFSRYGLKATSSREQLPLHPLVRKARGTESRIPSRMVEIDKRGNDFVKQADLIRIAEEGNRGNGRNEDMALHDDEEIIVSTLATRRAYHRHELVALQAYCPKMDSEVQRRAVACGVYQPTAFERNRKRLATNVFDEADFDSFPDRTEEAHEEDITPGFTRVIPKRQSLHGAPTFGSRSTAHTFSTSPGSRPPLPVGLPGQGPPGFPAINNNSNASVSTVPPFPRRSSTPNIAPTVSQFSGQERVVDFGSLRRKPPP